MSRWNTEGYCRIPSHLAVLHFLYIQTATVGILKLPELQNQAFSTRGCSCSWRESYWEISDSNGQSDCGGEGSVLNSSSQILRFTPLSCRVNCSMERIRIVCVCNNAGLAPSLAARLIPVAGISTTATLQMSSSCAQCRSFILSNPKTEEQDYFLFPLMNVVLFPAEI